MTSVVPGSLVRVDEQNRWKRLTVYSSDRPMFSDSSFMQTFRRRPAELVIAIAIHVNKTYVMTSRESWWTFTSSFGRP